MIRKYRIRYLLHHYLGMLFKRALRFNYSSKALMTQKLNCNVRSAEIAVPYLTQPSRSQWEINGDHGNLPSVLHNLKLWLNGVSSRCVVRRGFFVFCQHSCSSSATIHNYTATSIFWGWGWDLRPR
jgi:hypothetical protein